MKLIPGIIFISFLIFVGVYGLRARRRRAKERAWHAQQLAQERARFREAWELGVKGRLRDLDNGIPHLDPQKFGFNAQKNELLVTALPSRRMQTKTLTHRSKGVSIKEDVIDDKGSGMLFITTKRVVFDAHHHGANWSRTWKFVVGWKFPIGQLLVECTTGRPMIFDLRQANRHIDSDQRVLSIVMELASNGGMRKE